MPTTERAPKRVDGAITFRVDKVRRAAGRLEEIPRRAMASRLSAQAVERVTPDAGTVINGHAVHALLEAVHYAFVDHRPLVLSPDHLWLTICQGLSQHLRLAPELVRERVVIHSGREGVRAFYDDAGEPDWPAAIDDLRRGVQEGAPALHDLVMQEFSTTGETERMAYMGVLLEMAGAYFGYNLYPICGIPSITLRGEPADWERIVARIEDLARYGLGFWLEHLRPIVRQFASASRGGIDTAHWQRIYRRDPACSVTYVSGWIARLFPYIKNGRNQRCDIRNPLLADADARGLAHSLFPAGVSLVHLRDDDGAQPARAFVSGFLGTTQSATLALEPSIGWGVLRQGDPRPLLGRLRPHLRAPGVDAAAIRALVDVERLDMPYDLQALYRAGDGGSVPLGAWGRLELLPLADLRSVRSGADHDGYSDTKPIPDDQLPRFRFALVEFGRFSDGSTLCWAQRAGGPEILFVRRIPGAKDWIVAVTLGQLVEGLLDKSPTAGDVDGCLRRRKEWAY